MINNNVYNVVRQAIPNCPFDDQGLVDIANVINDFSTDITRLRFVGFRYSRIVNLTSFSLASNEIGVILSITGSVTFTINTTTAGSGNQLFGHVFNTITAGSAVIGLNYALFTYE